MNRVRKLLRKLENRDLKHEREVAELRELIYETYLKMAIGSSFFSFFVSPSSVNFFVVFLSYQ